MIERPDQPTSTPQAPADGDRSYQIPPPAGASPTGTPPPATLKEPRSYNPPPPKKSKGGKWLLFGAIVMTMIFFGLLALLLLGGLLLGGGGGSQNNFREHELKSGTSGRKVVVIPIHGMILSQKVGIFGGSATVTTIRERLKMAMADPTVAAIILDVNSPGGEVTATDEIHHLLMRIRKEKGIPIITCMRSVAASGGYYLAAASDHIVANRLTMTGSIGVVIGGANYSKLLEKIGIEGRAFKSGPMKDMGNPGRLTLDEIAERRLELKRRIDELNNTKDPHAAEEIALIHKKLKDLARDEEIVRQETKLFQKMVDDSFREFAEIVSKGRGIPLAEVMDPNGEIGNAQIISGAEAYRLKLVDQLGFMDDAIAHARKTGDHTVVEYERVPGLLSALSGRVQAEKTSMVKALLPDELRLIKKGRLYYLNPNLL